MLKDDLKEEKYDTTIHAIVDIAQRLNSLIPNRIDLHNKLYAVLNLNLVTEEIKSGVFHADQGLRDVSKKMTE